MGNHLDMAQRQIEDRSELSRVRAELAIQRKALANLEEREVAIVGRMDERLLAIASLLEADKAIGLAVEQPALEVTIETTPVDADADADAVDLATVDETDLTAVDLTAVLDAPVDRPNGAAAF
jgi:shikimate 5-dehydrogenase